MTHLIIYLVAPIATRTGGAFVGRADGSGGYEQVTTNVYPSSPKGVALRTMRVERAKMSLGEASTVLGINPVGLSALENGSATCDWDEASERLLAAVKEVQAK